MVYSQSLLPVHVLICHLTVLFTAVHVFDSYVHEDERGVHPEVEFIYDLKLPEDFEPINADGEVQEFKLYPVTQVKNETFLPKKIIIIFNLPYFKMIIEKFSSI